MVEECFGQILPWVGGASFAEYAQIKGEVIWISEEAVAFPVGLLPMSLAQKLKILRSLPILR